jgi:hypothetical protein
VQQSAMVFCTPHAPNVTMPICHELSFNFPLKTSSPNVALLFTNVLPSVTVVLAPV